MLHINNIKNNFELSSLVLSSRYKNGKKILRGTEDFLIEGVGGIQAAVKTKRKGCDLCYLSVKAGFGNERASVLKTGRWQEDETRTEKVFGQAQQNYSTMLL